jgi:hypothetical protein
MEDVGDVADFRFVVGVVPLSTWFEVGLSLLAYWVCLVVIKKHVQQRGRPYELWTTSIVHNCFLAISSAVLLVDMVLELYRMFFNSGFVSVYFDPDGRWIQGRIYYLLYVNYLYKYVELLDTFLLALRGRPTPFLHVYHHSATLFLCFTQLRGETCLQWLVVVANLFVHVVMYSFYALHGLGYNVWWKKYVTILQITQFVVAVGCAILPLATLVLQPIGWISWRAHGHPAAAAIGITIISSYLVLFIRFYTLSYPKPTHTKSNTG